MMPAELTKRCAAVEQFCTLDAKLLECQQLDRRTGFSALQTFGALEDLHDYQLVALNSKIKITTNNYCNNMTINIYSYNTQDLSVYVKTGVYIYTQKGVHVQRPL